MQSIFTSFRLNSENGVPVESIFSLFIVENGYIVLRRVFLLQCFLLYYVLRCRFILFILFTQASALYQQFYFRTEVNGQKYTYAGSSTSEILHKHVCNVM